MQRVQRVPVTESQVRIHTSAAGVLVLPEAEPVDVEINDSDLGEVGAASVKRLAGLPEVTFELAVPIDLELRVNLGVDRQRSTRMPASGLV